MKTPEGQPLFSVIIPTRNRSALFEVALNSVLAQRFRAFELIVANDGSSAEHESRYSERVAGASRTASLLNLVRTARGHGQSYGLNYGAARARNDYLCLHRVAAVIAADTLGWLATTALYGLRRRFVNTAA